MALTYFILPTTMGSRRLWISMLVTVLAHIASMIIMCIKSARSIVDRGDNSLVTMSAPVITSINWEGFGMSGCLAFCPKYRVYSQEWCLSQSLWRSPSPAHSWSFRSTYRGLCPLLMSVPQPLSDGAFPFLYTHWLPILSAHCFYAHLS